MDASALFGHNAMHCLDTATAKILLGLDCAETLLDIGAGTGQVTAQLVPLFDGKVLATEASFLSAWRARTSYNINCIHQAHVPNADEIGIHIHDSDSGKRSNCFDVVALLNVLDRYGKHSTLFEY